MSPRLVTNAGGKQSSAMARAMNFPTIYIQHWTSEQNRSFLVLNHEPAYPMKYQCQVSVDLHWPQKAPLGLTGQLRYYFMYLINYLFVSAFHMFSFCSSTQKKYLRGQTIGI